MRTKLTAALATGLALGVVGAACAAEATTQPVARASVQDVYDLLHDKVEMFARWGCVLAGLALVGVVWVIWSMKTLARNQVELARMLLREASKARGGRGRTRQNWPRQPEAGRRAWVQGKCPVRGLEPGAGT